MVSTSDSVGARQVLLLSLLALLGCVAPSVATSVNNVTKFCNASAPAVYNCLTSCKKPCKDSSCLYKCHYDTILQVLALSVTPPAGPSLPAFFDRVARLGLYFEDDVKMRIDPVGVYAGRVVVADYIATFVHPYGPSTVVTIANVDITHYVNTDQVAASFINLMYFKNDDPTRRIVNITIAMFTRFNPVTQKIIEADWNFLRFAEFQLDLQGGVRVTDATSASIIKNVCQVDARICGPLGYGGYDNVTDCEHFIASLPRIADFGIQGNNQYCRFLHMAYATVDPKHHCPHISRSGGGVCVDQVYEDYYKVFPYLEFVGKKLPAGRRANN